MATGRRSRRGIQTAAIAVAAALLALSLIGMRDALASGGEQARASREVGVDIDHFAFHPHTLRITRGTEVAFSNSSRVTHTATGEGSFDTGRIKPGESIGVRFDRRGTFAYHCEIHPFMHGKIVVE